MVEGVEGRYGYQCGEEIGGSETTADWWSVPDGREVSAIVDQESINAVIRFMLA